MYLPMIDQKIFKSYDVRGTYPDQLNEEAARAVGRAFARHAHAAAIVVGSDMRLSGPAIKAALIDGITSEGVDVIDIGLVSIDLAYATVGIFGYEAAIMVTASHNPKEYNGFKMVLKNMEWVRGSDIQAAVAALPTHTPNEKRGTVRTVDLIPKFINHLFTFVDVEKIKPFKVVVDAGNGMAGKFIPLIAERLPITLIPLNFKLDGNFPAHPSNPLLPESHAEISGTVVRDGADFGVLIDGDTDRLIFFDEQGRFIRADITLLVLARLFLEREPGAGIVYNAICSRSVPEFIRAWGGRPIRTKVGYVNVSAGLRDQHGVLGGELSSHYSFRDHAFADSGFIAFLIMLEELSRQGKRLSAVVAPFYKYAKGDEVNIEIDDIPAALDRVRTHYRDAEIDELDGVTVNYPDWWVNVRPSNTEPLLRITVEAPTEQLLKQKTEEVLRVIRQQ